MNCAPHRHRNAVKTHCIRGHAFDSVNTYLENKKDGSFTRRCRACRAKANSIRHREVGRYKRGYKGIIEYRKGPEIHGVWKKMKGRCYNKNDVGYARYGGRGIKVCESWHKYNNFYDDMISTYKKGLSIDRIDNDGDYEPSNCRWATPKQQCNNKSDNRRITYKGITKNMQEWANMFGVKRETIAYRLNNSWPVELALTKRTTYSKRYN